MVNPLLRPTPHIKKIDESGKSKGILDDFAVRKNVATKEGTIEKVPVNNNDIANKAYVDAHGGVTDHTALSNIGTNTHAQIDTAITNLTTDLMADSLHRHSELSASDGTPNPALQVDASGNVGIGATSPSFLFDVQGGSVASIRILSSDSPLVRIYSTSGQANSRNWCFMTNHAVWGDMDLMQSNANGGDPRTAGTSRLYIKNDGNVGIGTTSPTSPLYIVGNCSADSFTDRTPYPDTTSLAYEALKSVEGKDGIINKEKMHPILKEKEERNLSMTISVLLEVVKDLNKRIESLEEKK